ncbi:class I SAM-dependent methyltransferase [Segetibacter aerophilus]|uniref:Methyltransferase domain-containing protein n=1 Tax=Segetibacter aerophilus TaxID=670293 RepID=A0A512BES2_9BACT|nr:class I SAM-dependent methyltransferase [Segetibacter aerophilus]GEO10444.1 hypothetical protein SAE01_29400 [Segetibacter aerophilus]
MKKEGLTEDQGPVRNKAVNEHRLNFAVARGETQKNVNKEILKFLTKRFEKKQPSKILDLPCGTMLFASYLKLIFPSAQITGADIQEPAVEETRFVKMDLTKEFSLLTDETYDLITSISGIMMFGNTLSFISNCSKRLTPEGTFIITNDNSATILDKLFFLFLGRFRLFKPVFEDSETLIQNVSIQELCRLLRTNGLEIETIKYTSIYVKDLLFFPIAILIYPIQTLYLYYKTKYSTPLVRLMFPFKQYFCRHYIIVARKVSQVSA